jgi:adenosylcobinamide kinase / adenosylcobinamide-phosphate guanylyltransferase
VTAQQSSGAPVLIDCLTLWLSNVMLGDRDVDIACRELVAALTAARGPIVAVSNEVGFGIVPDNTLARAFRDAQGRLNQEIAACADSAVLIAAGLPLKLK